MNISDENPSSSQTGDELRDHIVRLLNETAQLRSQIEANEFQLYQHLRSHRRMSNANQSREKSSC